MDKDILIMGVESSCDETSIAVVKNGREILSNVISTQIEIHRKYGGVVPEIASRNHIKNIDRVYVEALKQANVKMEDISAIAVTYGAGLMGALIVGVSFAKSLAYVLNKPLIAVNHINGHISANYITHKELEPPFVCLVVSGGHTALFNVESHTKKKLISTTADDAIGEAFDKVARECGLPYPGGPSIQKEALKGKASINFIRKPKNAKDMSFSYSGLKTAVINYLHNANQRNEVVNIPDVCASFQKEAVEIVVDKAVLACKEFNSGKLVLAGGVSANTLLRDSLLEKCKENNIKVFYPEPILCTDNGAMIASQGYFQFENNEGYADLTLEPNSCIPFEE